MAIGLVLVCVACLGAVWLPETADWIILVLAMVHMLTGMNTLWHTPMGLIDLWKVLRGRE